MQHSVTWTKTEHKNTIVFKEHMLFCTSNDVECLNEGIGIDNIIMYERERGKGRGREGGKERGKRGRERERERGREAERGRERDLFRSTMKLIVHL